MRRLSDNSIHQRFSSRLGLLLSALGIAVGTGNIWRFPRIVAQSGGDHGAGAFLVAWLAFLFLWSVPLIISEYVLGRRSRSGVLGVFKKNAGARFTWMGAFVGFVSTAIAFFYAVIVAWCIYYFLHTLFQPLPLSTASAMAVWNRFQQSGLPFLFHAAVMLLGALVVWRGITSIEKVNKVLIPTLLIIVLISVVRALTLPGAGAGVAYLFTPEWSQLLRPKIWLSALTQNAWDTGAGWGLFLTYAAYMKREHKAVKNAFVTGLGNNAVSLLAALMICGTVFAVLGNEMGMTDRNVLEIMKTSGPASTGLTFIWMPQLFARMVMGTPLAALFFLGLTFAGFSSLIAMLELSGRVLVDTGMRRSRAIVTVAAVCYLLGIPSAASLDFLSNQDYVWGIALMISGAFIAFAVLRVGFERLRAEDLKIDVGDWRLGRWWEMLMRYFVPLAAVILLIWWLTLSATVYAPHQWFNPFNAYSVMTCLIQWAIMLGLFMLLNRWLSERWVPGVSPNAASSAARPL